MHALSLIIFLRMGQGRVKVNPTDDVYPRTSFAGPGSDTGLGISKEEKEELIKERQDELIKVLDRHDDLVRGACLIYFALKKGFIILQGS